MSFINKRDFSIIQGTNMDSELDDYFEVDELIALPISLLNKKGYLTKFCCSGHAFLDRVEIMSSEPIEDFTSVFGIDTARLTDTSYLQICDSSSECYIIFSHMYILPELPDRFYFDECDTTCIRCDYATQPESFERMKEVLSSMELLYEWVQSLPTVKYHEFK